MGQMLLRWWNGGPNTAESGNDLIFTRLTAADGALHASEGVRS